MPRMRVASDRQALLADNCARAVSASTSADSTPCGIIAARSVATHGSMVETAIG